MNALFEALPPPYQALRSVRMKALTPAEQIAQHLGRAILSGECPGGSRILEQDIADRFSVSRGPVRDALRELQKQGLVEITPRRGSVAVDVDFDDIVDMFNIRGAMLSLVVRYIARQPDRASLARVAPRLEEMRQLQGQDNPSLVEYVKAIGRIATGLVQACGSRQLLLTYRNLPHDTVWQMLWVTSEPLDYTTPERRSLSFRHHQDLFDHMGAGDANGAERVMRKIMNDSCLEVLGRMAQTRQIELDPGRIEAL